MMASISRAINLPVLRPLRDSAVGATAFFDSECVQLFLDEWVDLYLKTLLERLRPQQLCSGATGGDPGPVAHLDAQPARIEGRHRGDRVQAHGV